MSPAQHWFWVLVLGPVLGLGIEHDCGPLETGRDLREQFQPLAAQRGFAGGKAGGVSTRAVEPTSGTMVLLLAHYDLL
jgi:hypothetical protein